MEESRINTDSNKDEEADKPLTVWERLFGFLTTWDLKTNLIIWLMFLMLALLLSFLLMVLSF
jgi:hypothetical protein